VLTRFYRNRPGEEHGVARRLLIVLVAAVLLAGCGGGNGDDGGNGGDGGDGAALAGNAAAGEEVFSANCGRCHVLEEAGTNGTTGPNLEDDEYSVDEVAEQVREGGGGMPSFDDDLSEQEIADVAAFVSQSSGDG
jgi:mono/diheme cytochrome c family protein